MLGEGRQQWQKQVHQTVRSPRITGKRPSNRLKLQLWKMNISNGTQAMNFSSNWTYLPHSLISWIAMTIRFRSTITVKNKIKSTIYSTMPKQSHVIGFCQNVLMNRVEAVSGAVRLSRRSYRLKAYSPPEINSFQFHTYFISFQIILLTILTE